MYYYILDPRNIPQKDFERNLTELQTLLTEFKINGELARITPLRMIPEMVDNAASRGARTLVVCGSDETFHQALAAVRDLDFTLAFVPFTADSQLGKILGTETVASAVKTLASRRTERMDVAKIGQLLFLSYLEIGLGAQTNQQTGMLALMKLFNSSPVNLKLRIDDSYNVSSKVMGALLVNTRIGDHDSHSKIGDPQDSFLDLLLLEKLNKFSILRYKKEILAGCYEKISGSTAIRCKKVELLEPLNMRISMNGREVARMPSVVEILPGKLKMIVGKSRTF